MRREEGMKKSDQDRILKEFEEKKKKEVKLTKINLDEFLNNIKDTGTKSYKQIRVMLIELKKNKFELEKGDYIAICNIKKIGEKIYLETDVGNILQPLAPVYKHSKMCFNFLDFQKIWNHSVEL